MKHPCPLGILLDSGQYVNDKRNTYVCSVSYHCSLGVILFYKIVFTLSPSQLLLLIHVCIFGRQWVDNPKMILQSTDYAMHNS
jgi:hypothetical protein